VRGENDPSRFARAKELFQTARALSGEERARYLSKACRDDRDLRAEVEDLLEHAEHAEGFLDGAPRVPTLPAATVEISIPGFRLIEVLATGASGVVYRAEQARPRREVAVKVLRLDSLGPGQVTRFHREGEILAHLAHPGIAQVLGAGVAESETCQLPWIAMELVHGRDLSHWLAEERPDVRARVRLFRGLCEAVQHAHERGVVHRDLKPSNVLVQNGGVPRVIDFGIARSEHGERAASERTRTGLVLGTLAYMAPEQAAGDRDAVGAASDVYSIGVMLFEALTGALPLELDALDLLEGVRVVTQDEPRRLRTLMPQLPTDLETILIKALEKDPGRRYATAGALGGDLERWLEDRPVLARRPTVAYQARKFVRRNRALMAGAGTVILALVVALLQLRSRLAGEREASERMAALTATLSSKYFGLTDRLGFNESDREDAEQLIALMEEELTTSPGDRRLIVPLARALHDVGSLYQGAGAHAQAASCYRRALDLCEQLVASDPEDRETRSFASRLCAKLGEAARGQGDLAERDRWFAEALARDEALVARFPDDLELREDLGWSLDRVACAAAEAGDQARALELRLRRLADAEELVRLQPDSWKFTKNLSHVHYFLIDADASRDHLAESLRLARRTVELRPGDRDNLYWQAQVERRARSHAPDVKAELEPALAACDLARRLASEDASRWEHVEVLRRAGSEVLSVAERLGNGPLERELLRGLRETYALIAPQPGGEVPARLMEAEARLFEARLLASEGDGDGARTLEDDGWSELAEALLSEHLRSLERGLGLEVLITACWERSPSGERLTDLLQTLRTRGAVDLATSLEEDLAKPGRLPEESREALVRYRRARDS
jgi:tetratricopeptide (TPR) repeat protein/predicted Ser/Thr protein kinase